MFCITGLKIKPEHENSIAVDESQDPELPGMDVEWWSQKCGAGEFTRHEMVMGGTVKLQEDKLPDKAVIVMWFSFENEGGAGSHSTMTWDMEQHTCVCYHTLEGHVAL